ncbi:hypothetical protein BGW80DRAFT_1252118 [Lactifluus volemus]|nr:hypothetical protein BGW80DRAFT_1252118 [Lactifluus volemus]
MSRQSKRGPLPRNCSAKSSQAASKVAGDNVGLSLVVPLRNKQMKDSNPDRTNRDKLHQLMQKPEMPRRWDMANGKSCHGAIGYGYGETGHGANDDDDDFPRSGGYHWGRSNNGRSAVNIPDLFQALPRGILIAISGAWNRNNSQSRWFGTEDLRRLHSLSECLHKGPYCGAGIRSGRWPSARSRPFANSGHGDVGGSTHHVYEVGCPTNNNIGFDPRGIIHVGDGNY